jgi:hypothetical protein
MGFAMDDCKICKNRIYYRNRLFIPGNTELKCRLYTKHIILEQKATREE